MNLTEIAEQLNTSTMTIYRRLRKAGLNIADLRDEKSGEVTAAGASAIAALFDSPHATAAERVITPDTERDATGTTAATAAQAGQVDTAAAVQIATLTAQVEGLQALIAQLEGERDELRRQLDAVTAALHAEQADRQQERRLLTASTAQADSGEDHRQRRGFFDFLRRRT